ncbi:MAG: hypothetical protein K2J74_00285, partial [Muribaculaceae bacterium]|nr:hypothetical protein [Muribaculaceae bacterium]
MRKALVIFAFLLIKLSLSAQLDVTMQNTGLIDYVEETPYICDFTTIDNLTYEYNGNQVKKITDSGTDPSYYDAQQ